MKIRLKKKKMGEENNKNILEVLENFNILLGEIVSSQRLTVSVHYSACWNSFDLKLPNPKPTQHITIYHQTIHFLPLIPILISRHSHVYPIYGLTKLPSTLLCAVYAGQHWQAVATFPLLPPQLVCVWLSIQ